MARLKMLKDEFPSVTVIENPANLGFTVPTNQALRHAQGEFLCSSTRIQLSIPAFDV